MRVVVIYESLTGNTRKAAGLIADELRRGGHGVTVCPVNGVDYQALADADVVVVGTWTDGMVFFGQRPGRAGRLRRLPFMQGKRCVVFCTYAVDQGGVLEKLVALLEERGAEVLGGMAIRRDRMTAGVSDFVDRLLAAVNA